MKTEINLDYSKSLIQSGSKSEKFKLLPKDANELSISEYFFLMDYLSKVKIK